MKGGLLGWKTHSSPNSDGTEDGTGHGPDPLANPGLPMPRGPNQPGMPAHPQYPPSGAAGHQARLLVKEGYKALNAGDYVRARQMAEQARALNAGFKIWEDNPDKLLADIERLCGVESEGVMGTIAGRAIYDGSLDFAAAQKRADELSNGAAMLAEPSTPKRKPRSASSAAKTTKRQNRSAPEKSVAPQSGQRFPKNVYERELIRLQGELVKLQEWIRAEDARLVIVFEEEGRRGRRTGTGPTRQLLSPREQRQPRRAGGDRRGERPDPLGRETTCAVQFSDADDRRGSSVNVVAGPISVGVSGGRAPITAWVEKCSTSRSRSMAGLVTTATASLK